MAGAQAGEASAAPALPLRAEFPAKTGSWPGSTCGITALGEKLITNMNQPCFFLLSLAPELCRGVGRAPLWMYRKSYEGKHEASYFSPGPSCYLHFKSTWGFTALHRKRIPSTWQAGRRSDAWVNWLVGFHPGCDHWAVFHFREPHPHPSSAAPPGLSYT